MEIGGLVPSCAGAGDSPLRPSVEIMVPNRRYCFDGCDHGLFFSVGVASVIKRLDQEGKAMFVRCAYFKGAIKPGMEETFHAHWREHVLPHWRAFPHLLELRVMRDVESDDDTSRFPLVMAMKFAERAHIAEALSLRRAR